MNIRASYGTPTAARIRVAVVEDEPLFRGLLQHYLSQHPRLKVVGAYADGTSALKGIVSDHPDVVTLDIELPGRMDGIQAGIALRRQASALSSCRTTPTPVSWDLSHPTKCEAGHTC